jgi:hypothetical protein
MGINLEIQRLPLEEERRDNPDKATEDETGLQEHVGLTGAGETAVENHQLGGRQGILSDYVIADTVGCSKGTAKTGSESGETTSEQIHPRFNPAI